MKKVLLAAALLLSLAAASCTKEKVCHCYNDDFNGVEVLQNDVVNYDAEKCAWVMTVSSGNIRCQME